MNNTEISRRLALAIGYGLDEVSPSHFGDTEVIRVRRPGYWAIFDHLEWRTIGPIAARYKMFPKWCPVYEWWELYVDPRWVKNNCPATCSALAVIEASDRGLLS